jgi:hypothetical protein
MARDLFGLQALADGPLVRGAGKRKRKPTRPRGYVFTPGTGPEGETCGSCLHIFRNRLSRTYLKCSKNKSNWTGGPASDILSRSPACKFWEAQPPEKP